jgi:NAD(P)H-hydrate epimerase
MVAMRVLSAAEMQACDRATTERYGIPSIDLMRHAAASIAAIVRLHFPRVRRVTVLCGRGNNGGDGMMAARLLAEHGHSITVVLLGDPGDLQGDAATAWQELNEAQLNQTCACPIHILRDPADLAPDHPALDTDLIVDAIVGTGFKPPLKGLALAALEWVKSAQSNKQIPILAVDLPSGWPADSTQATITDPVFPADAVVTFTAPKPIHVFGLLTRRWDQPIVVAPIGSPDSIVLSDLNLAWTGSAQSLYHQPRPTDSNKGKYGHILVVGGSFGSAGGKAGAPVMASLAALRAGAGLVTAAVPAPALPVVSSYAPELMTWPLLANTAGQASPENLSADRIAALTRGITVLAIGPGLGQSDDTARFCLGLLEATSMPVVIDADALNILAHDPSRLTQLTQSGRTVVLTPHPGEMSRLAGRPIPEIQANRLDIARGFARQYGVTLVLKGARTLIAHPDGRVAVNTTGNPGMAKGGSGDLLTGVIAALLGQFSHDPQHAVEAAVFLHGLAADFAVHAADEHTLLATDSLPHLSQAFRFRSRAGNGYVWLQGLPPEVSANGSSFTGHLEHGPEMSSQEAAQ